MWRDTSTAIGILAFAPLGTPSPAMADPPPAEIDWSGFYAGVQLGGGLSLVDVNDPFGASLYGDTVRTPGTLGGFQAGYNWQWDAFLLGLETDVDLASMSGTNTCLAFSGFYVSANCQAGVDALGTLTGRLGIAFGPAGSTLLYGKAGLAWMYGNLDVTPNGGFGLPDSEKRGVEWGYTLGAGAEQALDPNWSVRAEYDFLSFATADFSAPASLSTAAFASTPGAASQFSQDFQTFKLGLNYRFGGGGGPLPAEQVVALPARGLEIEAGGRYVAGWGQFHKDLSAQTVGVASLA